MALVQLMVILFGGFALSFWDAFVVAKMWNWFATAALPSVSTLQVYGLVLMFNVLRGHKPTAPTGPSVVIADAQAAARKSLRGGVESLWNRSVATLMALGFAALAHHWMVRP